jgi:hypothetical protein
MRVSEQAMLKVTGPASIVVTAVLLAAPPARADVYTWVDASGNVTVSNLAPPSGVRITHVTHENPAAIAHAKAAQSAAQQAQVQALTQRVAELEREAEAPKAAPPPVTFLAPPAPPPPQYVVTMAPGVGNDAVAPPYGCAWIGCALPPLVYPVAVFVWQKPFRFSGHHRFERRPGGHFQRSRAHAPTSTVLHMHGR